MSVHFQLRNLPLSILFVLQVTCLVWGQASQAPPTSFGSDSITGSATTQASATAPSSVSANSTSASGTQTSSAQLPTLSGYSSCVVNSLQLAVSDMNCGSIAEFECYCRNASFPSALISRMAADCPNELSTAEGLAQQFCNLASTSIAFSVTSMAPTGSSNTSGQTTPTPTSPGNGNSGGSGSGNGTGNGNGNSAITTFTSGSVVGLSVALMGVALGGLIL